MTDQPSLRDRIRRAICEASGFTWLPDELMEFDEYGEHADAVLAVLPEPADADRLQGKILELESELAKVRDLLRTENQRANDAIDREDAAEQAALEAFADRAAALWASAGPLSAAGIEEKPDMNVKALHVHAHDDADLADLRRMADEAQQPEEALCGKTVGVGLPDHPYRPCARPAGHSEAYCRDATGQHHFLAAAEQPDVEPEEANR